MRHHTLDDLLNTTHCVVPVHPTVTHQLFEELGPSIHPDLMIWSGPSSDSFKAHWGKVNPISGKARSLQSVFGSTWQYVDGYLTLVNTSVRIYLTESGGVRFGSVYLYEVPTGWILTDGVTKAFHAWRYIP